MIQTTCLGFPRMGAHRELKRALESHWSGKSSAADLLAVAAHLRARHWTLMRFAGLDELPVGDFSLYDHVLDTAVMVGAVPRQYRAIADPLGRYFAMARGYRRESESVPALEMTKWFDTNYHYLVPEIEAGQQFGRKSSRRCATSWQQPAPCGRGQAMPCDSCYAPDRCPLCGGPNHCGVAAGEPTCWCFDIEIHADVKARIPAEARDVACVCAHCAGGQISPTALRRKVAAAGRDR